MGRFPIHWLDSVYGSRPRIWGKLRNLEIDQITALIKGGPVRIAESQWKRDSGGPGENAIIADHGSRESPTAIWD